MAKKSKSRIWIIITVIGGLILLAVTLYFLKGGDKATKVLVEKTSRRTIKQTVAAIGKIQPEVEVKISSETSGEIVSLLAKEGNDVKKGQLLARIKPDLFETQLEQYRASVKASSVAIEIAKIEVERTEIELKRTSDLYKKEYASKQDLDNAKAAYDRAQGQYQTSLTDKLRADAALKQIEVSVSRTSIFAPINGTVTKLAIQQGEKVLGTAQMQGTEMMRVSDLSVMNAIVDVDESDVVKVKIGDTARIKIDAFPNRTLNGFVYEISHSPKQKGLGTQDEVINFEVKIRLIDSENALRPGMSCNVEIETEIKDNIIAVPLQSVTIRSDSKKDEKQSVDSRIQTSKVGDENKRDEKPPQVVFVFDNGKVKQKVVETGISDKGYIEIKSGVIEGESIVSGSYNTISKILQDNMNVQIDSSSTKKKK